MRRTTTLIVLALVTLAAAAWAALRAPRTASPTPAPLSTPAPSSAGPLTLTAQLERRWLSAGGAAPYLEVDVVAAGNPAGQPKAAVNAVLVVDRSGSMAGEKIARARDAARALIAALDGEDRLAIVDFASDARLLLPSTAMDAGARELARALVDQLVPTSGTNFSGALQLAGPQLQRGRAQGRVDKVFLASDGMVNEGIVERGALLAFARRTLEGATVSTFGVGADYDEELMTALASQAGGRTRFISSADELAPAFRAELSRSAAAVARDVRLQLEGLAGARVESVFGYELEGGAVRLPDFAAGESRRVLVRLRLPAGRGEALVARATVSCADAAGRSFRAASEAGGVYTADAARLAEPPSEVAAMGAKAEMASLAQQAVRAFEQGDKKAAAALDAQIDDVSVRVQRELPAMAAPMQDEARQWRGAVGASATGGAMERKAAKQKAFDATRAPTAGW